MQCERARDRLSAYIDGELEDEARRDIAAHLEHCQSCTALASDFRRIGGLLDETGREPMPQNLAQRVRRSLADELEGERADARGPAARSPQMRRSLMRQAAALVATGALSAFATWWFVSASSQTVQLERDVLSAHVRSLLQETPVQIAASDTHVVKPWFTGRVDFAPDVKDLTSDGFPLVGGRLDYVAGRRAGALVYKRRLHTINVFMWPGKSGEDAPPERVTLNGYNLLRWSRRGLSLWAISDLNAAELREFQSLF